MGNICRSPAGENVFRHVAEAEGLLDQVYIDSAGTHSYHVGNAPDHRMTSTLEQRGIPVTGAARQFTKDDFNNFDLILVMDAENEARVLSLAKSVEDEQKVRRFTEFCTEFEQDEVPDPYYGGESGFELVASMIENGCQELCLYIAKKQND